MPNVHIPNRYIPIVYPEKKFITEKTLRLWFFDAVANGYILADEVDASDSLEYICKKLHWVGIITLREDWKKEIINNQGV